VLATQNPIELEGTYPLPEAQLDRFMFKLTVPFPSRASLRDLLAVSLDAEPADTLQPVASPADVLRISDVTGKAYMHYDECWYCMPCEADCPTGAVTVNIPYLLR